MHRTTSCGCCGRFYPPCGLYEMLSRTHDAHAWRVPPIEKHPQHPQAGYGSSLHFSIEGNSHRDGPVGSGLPT